MIFRIVVIVVIILLVFIILNSISKLIEWKDWKMASYSSHRFAVRKIRNGKVKIGGYYYKPNEDLDPYNDEFEGYIKQW